MDFVQNIDQARAVIFSVEGSALSPDEKAFFAEVKPFGFILFARNCETPEQMQALSEALHEAVGCECPILIDQEGGRVQRLRPPIWRGYPSMQSFGAMAENDLEKALDALRFTIMKMAQELRQSGVNVNCAPVLDVLSAATHDVIGDRAFSEDPAIVSRLGLSVCHSFLSAGIVPVIKHLPGHGRAAADSHKALPHVDASRAELAADFQPFKDIATSDIAPAVWGMAAHIVYDQIDAELPSSVSPVIINDIIRAEIGFNGVLLSDDLDMDALARHGDVAARALKTLEAGCDIALYCAGKLEDMQKIANSVPKLSEKAQERLQKAAEFTTIKA